MLGTLVHMIANRDVSKLEFINIHIVDGGNPRNLGIKSGFLPNRIKFGFLKDSNFTNCFHRTCALTNHTPHIIRLLQIFTYVHAVHVCI